MKTNTVYVCEKCKRESRSHDEVELCKAVHMGLTNLGDKRTWETLNKNAASATTQRCTTNNELTRKAEDEAYYELEDFEMKHGMCA